MIASLWLTDLKSKEKINPQVSRWKTYELPREGGDQINAQWGTPWARLRLSLEDRPEGTERTKLLRHGLDLKCAASLLLRIRHTKKYKILGNGIK